MPIACRGISLIALWAGLGACTALPAGPELTAVSPTVIDLSAGATTLTLQGRFNPEAQISLAAGDGGYVRDDFSVWLGATGLGTATYMDNAHLTVRVPATLAPGAYSVQVVAPDDTFAQLADALVVLPAVDPNNPNSHGARTFNLVVNITPLAGDTNTAFTGSTANSNDANYPLKKVLFFWDWQGNGKLSALGPSSTHQFTQPGTYSVHVVAFDPSGARADAYVTVVVAAQGALIQVEDPNDNPQSTALNLRQALDQASNANQATVVTALQPMRVTLSSPLVVTPKNPLVLVGNGITLDGNGMVPAAHAADANTPLACFTIEGNNNQVSHLALQSCGVAMVIRGAGNVVHDVTVQNSNTAMVLEGGNNTVGPNNVFTGLRRRGVVARAPSQIVGNTLSAMGVAAVDIRPTASGSVVRDNFMPHNTTAVVLRAGAHDVHVWFNTVDSNGAGIDATGATQVDVRNNIFSHLGTPLVNVAAMAPCAGNDFFANANNVTCPDPSNMAVDPQFDSAGPCAGFTLNANSPLLNAGVAIENTTGTWVGACGP